MQTIADSFHAAAITAKRVKRLSRGAVVFIKTIKAHDRLIARLKKEFPFRG